jgi:hypothetical protein
MKARVLARRGRLGKLRSDPGGMRLACLVVFG